MQLGSVPMYTTLCYRHVSTYIDGYNSSVGKSIPPEAANFSLKMIVSGDLCCVALSFCCVVLPCLVFLSISWMIKVMYIQ